MHFFLIFIASNHYFFSILFRRDDLVAVGVGGHLKPAPRAAAQHVAAAGPEVFVVFLIRTIDNLIQSVLRLGFSVVACRTYGFHVTVILARHSSPENAVFGPDPCDH